MNIETRLTLLEVRITELEIADIKLLEFMQNWPKKALADRSLKPYVERLKNLNGIRTALSDLAYYSKEDLAAFHKWRAQQQGHGKELRGQSLLGAADKSEPEE